MEKQTNTPKVSNCQKRLEALLARKTALADSVAAAKAEFARQTQRDRKWLCFVVGALILDHRADVVDGLLDRLTPTQKGKATRLLAAARETSGENGNQS